MYFRAKLTAAMCTLAGIGALVGGCAGAGPAGAPRFEDTAQARATYEKIVQQIYGTAEQRIAGEERGWLLTQSAISECMTAAGTVYPVTAFIPVNSEESVISPGDSLAFSPTRTTFGVGVGMQRRAAAVGQQTNPVYAKLDSEAKRAAYSGKLQSCQGAATTYEASFAPKSRDALDGLLLKTLATISRRAVPDLPAHYATCMKGAGFEAANLSDLYALVVNAYPPVTYDKPSDVTKEPGWASAVVHESKAADTDTACRADFTTRAFADATADLTEFASTNAAALSANEAAWAQMTGEVAVLRQKAATR
ncbi:hypothetical protein Cme02nite_63300 [Catellatospora methionotrophica]|uniref:Lipoprotein n=2 Tax=Catellatospora methionotrophica TaxID=121620 RepID=A0A8J3LGN3_9ACTN|nr:hypothetical protein Cme02nite_63300 [Catellatospora methionotrophica]